MTVGAMQAVADAIAEANNEIAGFFQTRITAVIIAGQTIWPVESVLDWPLTGKVLARGTVYSYSARSDTALEGITHTDGETIFIGAAIQIPEEQVITDQTRLRTAMDLLRASMLVEFAEGADLDIVARNIGVNRLPSVSDDDIFRAVVKAFAYNPKGTIFGMELFLDAALGAANYEIIEDLIEEPNKVKINLLGALLTSDDSIGKAFLTGQENRPEATPTTLNISAAPVTDGTVHGVRFRNEDHQSDFRTTKPSAENIVEYEGDTGTQAWFFDGTDEIVDVIQIAGEAIEILDTSGTNNVAYVRSVRIQPESDARFSCIQLISSSGIIGGTRAQWGALIQDGAFNISWGVADVGSSQYQIGLTSLPTNALVAGAADLLNLDQYYDIEIRKHGQDFVELLIDGEVKQTVDYALFTTATTDTSIQFGSFSNTVATQIGRIKEARWFCTTPTDYWGGRGTEGAVLTANPRDLDVGAGDAIFAVGDVGKRLDIRGGTVSSGVNNGVFEIDVFNSAQNVTLKGKDQVGAFVETGSPTQFNAADRIFQFPDDVGKDIVIDTGPNAGSFTITQLLDPDDGSDLALPDTEFPVKTDTAIASAATFITETGIAWRLNPVFETEASLEWEASDMGSISGTVITLIQTFPTITSTAGGTPTRSLSVAFSEVLSAQILADITVRNILTDVGPPRVYTHFPFYLADPLGFVKTFLDLITAAGVIPEFEGP